jgi:hypothetical protein
MTVQKNSKKTAKPIKFDKKLVLNQWMLEILEVPSFEKIAEGLKNPELQGFDADNVSKYHHVLKLQLFERSQLSTDTLLAYDQNIVRHWKRVTEKRNRAGHVLYPKHFQYLSLLFAEIYLDRYFSKPKKLLNDLNDIVFKFNLDKPKRDQVEAYKIEDLNKVAFWMATGSGKTLLMHVNILQYQHYLSKHNHNKQINRIILLTPNEGLSHQHKEEFDLSKIYAELFSKNGRGLFTSKAVEIIDIHKLRDEAGDKTVAVEAFEGNNLVFVDEGHRGSSGKETGQWMQKREALCENGFSFEYSATFGQAVKASGNKDLEQLYAKCILFDYSYKYFYGDGYGKEYRILNLPDDSDENIRRRYLMACLLSFYQQQKLYKDKKVEYTPFLLEHPLWIFVGGSVNAVRTERKRKVSDVVDILLFLSDFISAQNRSECIELLDLFLKGKSGLQDSKGNDLFTGVFSYLIKQNFTGDSLYKDILKVLFNSNAPAALHVENLKGTDGEIALRLGDNEPFGLISVGDASALCKLCDRQGGLVVTDHEFSGSLFRDLSKGDSNINILIGSKKFTEGWSSWRVSTMGLMNIGKKEGSQIIQLFGRGVRLKGIEFCLKRSRRVDGVSAPPYIERLETLNVFGVRADYMHQFKEYLEDEGLPANEEVIEFVLPVIKNLGTKKLKTIKLKEGIDYKRQGPKPTLDVPDEYMKKYKVVLDWYPKIQAMASAGGQGLMDEVDKHEAHFNKNHLAFMDFEEIYFEMQQFKNERAWYNLNLSLQQIQNLFDIKDWYKLYIPKEEMEFKSFENVRRWQEIAVALLKKYCDRYYKTQKAAFEKEHLEYRTLTEDDPNFIEEYLFLVEQSREDIITKLQEIKELIESGKFKDIEFQGLKLIMFNRHLYQPLIHVKSDFIEVKPVALNEGEKCFVEDLKNFCTNNTDFFQNKELYLLRNQSRGKGIGFFEAGNFYPDFILWLLADGQQYINFIDPKGLRNTDGINDPKIRFCKTIKELETRLNDPDVTLNSFIISTTPLPQVSWWSDGMTKEQFEQHHVFFMTEDRKNYINKLFSTFEM